MFELQEELFVHVKFSLLEEVILNCLDHPFYRVCIFPFSFCYFSCGIVSNFILKEVRTLGMKIVKAMGKNIR